MNNQEIFNRVVIHLRKQGRKSHSSNRLRRDECKYRAPDGLRCAVGCLIDDEHYLPKLEGHGLHREIVQIALRRSLGQEVSTEMFDLLIQLQHVHDLYPVSTWEDKLTELAGLYELLMPEKEEEGPAQ